MAGRLESLRQTTCDTLVTQGGCRSADDNIPVLVSTEGPVERFPSEGWEQPKLEPVSSGSGGIQATVAAQGSSCMNCQSDTATVQQQMNQAIAAAVVSAAVSAVIESHAAAERAALLATAHEELTARELKRRQKETEVLEAAAAHVRMRIAAMQVARHWKSWRHGPAWTRRAVAATCVQSHTRGFLVRNNLPKIRHAADCTKKVCHKLLIRRPETTQPFRSTRVQRAVLLCATRLLVFLQF